MLSFEDFVAQVTLWCPGAAEVGTFRNFTAEGKIDSNRVLYEWYGQYFGYCSYDTDDVPPWMADNGRGVFGRGNTLEEADLDEKDKYVP